MAESNGWNLSKRAATDGSGLAQPRLNDFLRCKIDKFSLDALIDLTLHGDNRHRKR
ncbi:MAG: XRE family transcriptional regulator [Steroidobacteraceae bacterium]